MNAVAACSSVNACTSGHHLSVKSLRTETVSCISVSSPKVPDTSLWNEQKKEQVSEASGLAAATCAFLGQGLMAPENLPDPGIKPASLVSPVLSSRFFTTSLPGKPMSDRIVGKQRLNYVQRTCKGLLEKWIRT